MLSFRNTKHLSLLIKVLLLSLVKLNEVLPKVMLHMHGHYVRIEYSSQTCANCTQSYSIIVQP